MTKIKIIAFVRTLFLIIALFCIAMTFCSIDSEELKFPLVCFGISIVCFAISYIFDRLLWK